MGPSEQSYTIAQQGSWPYETYKITPNYTKIDPRLGNFPVVNYFPMVYNIGHQFGPLDNAFTNYNYGTIPFTQSPIDLKFYISPNNGDSFYWTPSAYRQYYNGTLFNTFFIKLDPNNRLLGYVLEPTRLFLKPLSAERIGTGWRIRTSAILLSAVPQYFDTYGFSVCALNIQQAYADNYTNKIELPLPTTVNVTYALSAVQKFIDRPLINFSQAYNPYFFNVNLENTGATIKANSTFINNQHDYFDNSGNFTSIGDIPLYNNARIYWFDSSLFYYNLSADRNTETFFLLQSAIDPNSGLNSTQNCILSSVINLSAANFKYYVNSAVINRTTVLTVTGRDGSHLGLKYVSDSPTIRNTGESVYSTVLNFQNLGLVNNLFSTSKQTGTDTTLWELKYPPHHYSFNLSFSDGTVYPRGTEESSLFFDLSSRVTNLSTSSVNLSTYLFSEFGVLKLDLETYGIYDYIKFNITDTIATVVSALCCYYSPTNKVYDLLSSPWIPATSGAKLLITYPNTKLGQITFGLTSTLSTYSGFMDSYYKTYVTLASNQSNTPINNSAIFQTRIGEGSDYLDSSVSSLTSESAFPLRDLTNSNISWSFYPYDSNTNIYAINPDNSYTLLTPNSSVAFGPYTQNVRLSGYGPNTMVLSISSQKYNEVALLTSTSALFNYFQEGRFVVGPIGSLNNLNTVRTVTLSAAIPYNGRIYPLPNNMSIFWTWEYDGIADPSTQAISARMLNGGDYDYTEYNNSNAISALNFFVEPTKNNFFPQIHNVKAIVHSFTNNAILLGSYAFDVDEFPADSIFSANFYTAYTGFPNTPISYTGDTQVLTRPLDNTSKYIFSANTDIVNNTTGTTLVWGISDSLSALSSLSGVTSIGYNISAARLTTITLSALNSIAAGWVSAHNVTQTLNVYSLPAIEFNNPLTFNIIPEFYWNNGRNLTITDLNNYTLSVAPTSYQNSSVGTYSFWVSANKQDGFDTYIYSTGDIKTSGISLLDIPYNSALITSTGLTVALTAFGGMFPQVNGLYYKLSGTRGLTTNCFNITATTIPFNTTGANPFTYSPVLIPYNNTTLTFVPSFTSLDVDNNRFVTVTQTISTTPFETPVQPTGGTVTYTLSSDYWNVQTVVPAVNGTFTLFSLNIGDPFDVLTIGDKFLNSLYISATASLDKIIPSSTFSNYPLYVGNTALWSTVTDSLTGSNAQTILAYTTSKNLNLFISEYYNITGNNTEFQVDNFYTPDANPIVNYYIDYGDGNSEILNIDQANFHSYNVHGVYNVALSSVYLDGTVQTFVNNKPLTIYTSWPNYDQSEIRLLNALGLTFPYSLDQVDIQPNEFGNVDIYNTAMTRLYDNLDYLVSNTKTINTDTPTDIFGWLGTNTYFKSEGIRWNTADYNSDYYNNYDIVASSGLSYFTKLESVWANSETLIFLDNGKIRYFTNGKAPIETSFINYEDFAKNFIGIDRIVANDAGTVLYVTDTVNNKIHRVDLEVSDISYIIDILDIGGFGEKDSPNGFSSPDKLVYRDSYVYVLDYNNECVKKYTEELTWVYTYYSTSFDANKIESFDIHPNTGLLYTINADYIIYIFDTDASEFFTTLDISKLVDQSGILDFCFDESGEFFYVVTSGHIYKFTTSGIYIGMVNLPSGAKAIKTSGNRTLMAVYNNFVIKIDDIVEMFGIGDGLSTNRWSLNEVLLDADELASDIDYNRSLQRMVQNIKAFRNTLDSKFVLATESTSSGSATYFAKKPIKVSDRPTFSGDIENELVMVGVNEFHIPQVFNREFSKIYDALTTLKTFLDIETVNASLDNGCQGVFCWSWKAMSCYNLSLPVIKLCNINPITFAELQNSFGVNYAPSKTWGNATSSCCDNTKSPL